MKKTVIASVALAAAMFAASCQKETSPIHEEFVPMTISAVAEGLNTPVKSAIEFKYDVTWTANDKIYVTDGNDKNDTFTIISESVGKTLGKFTQDGQTAFVSQETPSCDVEAYYPSSMMDGTTPTWPASQTYSPENAQTVPMYSKKTITATGDQTFSFGSLGSVLQIVFNTTQENVTLKSIEIKDGSATLSGAFTVDTDGKAVITATDKAGITLDLGTGKALGKAANYFNIAVPAGNYQDLTLVFTATDGTKCTMTGGKVNIAYNAVGRLTLMGEKFKADVPDGALAGKFSVSNDGGTTIKQVHFSQGNLYWDGSAFKFEANQYGFNSSYQSTYVSHFYWSKDADEAVKQDFNWKQSMSAGDVFFTNVDGFKVNVGGKDQTGWRTLSTNEWQYLFNTRTMKNGKDRYTLNITYGGKMGLVLYPDDYDKDPVTGTVTDLPDGVVFLPAAGCRDGSYVDAVGDYGLYWSSSAYDEYDAYSVYFDSDGVYPDGRDGRSYGYSVRLITESK